MNVSGVPKFKRILLAQRTFQKVIIFLCLIRKISRIGFLDFTFHLLIAFHFPWPFSIPSHAQLRTFKYVAFRFPQPKSPTEFTKNTHVVSHVKSQQEFSEALHMYKLREKHMPAQMRETPK